MQPLKIVRAAQHLAHLIGRPGFHVGAEIDAQHRGMLDQRLLVIDAPHRETSVARPARPGISLSADRAAHVLDAGIRQRPQLLRARQTDALHDGVDPLGKARRHEAAIAARRTCRDLPRFQHRDRPAAPRHFARDRQSCEPRPDDAHIHVEIVRQRAPLRHRDHRRRVPGRAIRAFGFAHRPLMPRCHGSRKPLMGMIFRPVTSDHALEPGWHADAPPDAVAPRQVRLGRTRARATTTARSIRADARPRRKWAPTWRGMRCCPI